MNSRLFFCHLNFKLTLKKPTNCLKVLIKTWKLALAWLHNELLLLLLLLLFNNKTNNNNININNTNMLVFVVISCIIFIITRLFFLCSYAGFNYFSSKGNPPEDAGQWRRGLSSVYPVFIRCICGSSAGLQLGRSLLRSDVVWSGIWSFFFFFFFFSPSSVSASTWYREILGWQWQGIYLKPSQRKPRLSFPPWAKVSTDHLCRCFSFPWLSSVCISSVFFFLLLPRHVCKKKKKKKQPHKIRREFKVTTLLNK